MNEKLEDVGSTNEKDAGKTVGLSRYLPKFEAELVWLNVLAFVYLHSAALYGIFLAIFYAKIQTTLFSKYSSSCIKISELN